MKVGEDLVTSAAPKEVRFRSGLEFDVARRADDAVRAWTLVYASYVKAGLIDPNPHQVHLVPQAVHPGTGVVIGTIDSQVASTMSIYVDRPTGLPLDRVYGRELDAMRHQGRRLVEVGLFADRRRDIKRTIAALLDLMRHVYFYSVHSGATDIVVGVHPDHRSFYERCLAFETFGPTAGCPSVKGHPMVPMRMRLHECMNTDAPPKGVAFFKAEPLGPEVFEGRFEPTADDFANTRVGRYLRNVNGRQRMSTRSE